MSALKSSATRNSLRDIFTQKHCSVERNWGESQGHLFHRGKGEGGLWHVPAIICGLDGQFCQDTWPLCCYENDQCFFWCNRPARCEHRQPGRAEPGPNKETSRPQAALWGGRAWGGGLEEGAVHAPICPLELFSRRVAGRLRCLPARLR